MTTTTKPVREINGCPVIYENGPASVIEHPAGFMVYAGPRLGTYKTFAGAKRRADRAATTKPVREDHWCSLCESGYPRTYEEHTGSQKHRHLVGVATGRTR